MGWFEPLPNGLSKEATTTCDAVMVEVSGPAIDKLVKENSYYFYSTIPAGMYQGSPNDTPTFGVGATFVSSTNTPENTVYQVVKAVFDNLDSFKKLHPAFNNLVAKDITMTSCGPINEEGDFQNSSGFPGGVRSPRWLL